MKTSMYRIIIITIVGSLLGPSLPCFCAPSVWVQWDVSSGGNGHWYKADLGFPGLTWSIASQRAQAEGGYLATITSAAENAFVFSLVADDPRFWTSFNGSGPALGGFHPDGSHDPASGWSWVTGEPWTYSNWWYWQPDYGWPIEDRLSFYSGRGGVPGSMWNDLHRDDTNIVGYVIEKDTGAGNQPPVASFKSLNVIELADPSDGGHMVGGVIRFDPTASYDPDGEIIRYDWDFDNGEQFTSTEPQKHDVVFEEPRIYTITLTVTNNDGLTNTFAETLDLSLKEGDLIFLRSAGYTTLFDLVGNAYTHVGMYVGNQTMIESIYSANARSSGLTGVVRTPLSGWSYSWEETYATLVRVETADDEIRQKAVEFVQSKLEQEYDTNVFQKNAAKPDYYCSELIWAAYYKASNQTIELGKKKKDKGGVWPDDIICDTVNSRIIGYHHEHYPPPFSSP